MIAHRSLCIRLIFGADILVQIGSTDLRVGVGIDHTRGATVYLAEKYRQPSAFWGNPRIVANGDPLADERGGDFKEQADEGEGGVPKYLAGHLVQECRVEIDGRIDGNDMRSAFKPSVQRRRTA